MFFLPVQVGFVMVQSHDGAEWIQMERGSRNEGVNGDEGCDGY